MYEMRKFTLPAILFTILAVGSCQEPERHTPTPPDRGDPTSIEVNISQLDQTTRVEIEDGLIKTEWSAGDKAGIYVLFKDELDAAGEYEISSDAAVSEDKTSADFNGEWKWHAAALPHTFYAYAPKIQTPPITDGEGNEVPVDADPTAVPISLPAAQTQDGYDSQFLSDNNFWIAPPREMTAPRNFNDPALDKKVSLEMKSAFSILEFRFASWEGEDPEKDVIIQKLTLTSDKRPLAMSKGTIDITKPAYDTNFGVITADEADFTSTVTLDITNGTDLPISSRQTVIIGNKSREPYDPDVVFPARMLVMPNRSIPLGANEEETWSMIIDFTVDGVAHSVVRDFTSRPLRAGERHAIPVILITSESGINPPPPEVPGEPWDGTTKTKPAIDDANRIIPISTPGELAWLADAINNQTVTNTEKLLYDNYTIRFMNNINLGGKPLMSIGRDFAKPFRGHIDGGDADVDLDGKPDGYLVSGLNIDQPGTYSTSDTEVIGLFGSVAVPPVMTKKEMVGETEVEVVVEGTGTASIRNLRVKGNVNSKNIYGDKYPHAGGIVGYVTADVPISGCRFEGNITGVIPTLGCIGGIVGKSKGSSITDCSSSANITVSSTENSVESTFGGVVGDTDGAVRDCEFTGTIRISSGNGSIGGIAGRSGYLNITACRNTGDLFGDDGMELAMGGIAGVKAVAGNIVSCYNTGDITTIGGNPNTKGSAGGIVGAIYAGGVYVRGCYSRGKVTASRQYVRVAGNIFGRAQITGDYAYATQITYNYYLYTPLFADQLNELDMTSVMQFSTSQWPQTSYPDWGVGDGSGNDKYWNEIFPDTYGTEDWEYPQLYWEVIK